MTTNPAVQASGSYFPLPRAKAREALLRVSVGRIADRTLKYLFIPAILGAPVISLMNCIPRIGIAIAVQRELAFVRKNRAKDNPLLEINRQYYRNAFFRPFATLGKSLLLAAWINYSPFEPSDEFFSWQTVMSNFLDAERSSGVSVAPGRFGLWLAATVLFYFVPYTIVGCIRMAKARKEWSPSSLQGLVNSSYSFEPTRIAQELVENPRRMTRAYLRELKEFDGTKFDDVLMVLNQSWRGRRIAGRWRA